VCVYVCERERENAWYTYLSVYTHITFHSFIHSHSVGPYKVTELYGYRNSQQTVY